MIEGFSLITHTTIYSKTLVEIEIGPLAKRGTQKSRQVGPAA